MIPTPYLAILIVGATFLLGLLISVISIKIYHILKPYIDNE